MNEKEVKPILITRQEFIDNILNEINNCKLPLFVIEYILQDILNTVKATVQQQFEAEKAQYEQLHKQVEASSNNKE